MPRVDTRVAAIFRAGGDPIIPEGTTVVEPNDEVFFIAARDTLEKSRQSYAKLINPTIGS